LKSLTHPPPNNNPRRQTMKLLNKTELKAIQELGDPVLFTHPALTNEFSDRLDIARQLFDAMTPEVCEAYNSADESEQFRYEKWEDDDIPDKIYAHRYGGPSFSYDEDVMVGPEDWEGDKDAPKVGDYVLRRKIYMYDWTRERIEESGLIATAEMEYFMDMLDTFKPVFEHYNKECLSDQMDNVRFYLTKVMLIEYSTPTATADNVVEHRKFNTERFGPSHIDETMLGLHLGENIQEVQTQNTVTGEWSFLPKDSAVLLFSEFAEQSGWNPTYHRMIHNTNGGSSDKRYVVAIDWQPRYKDDD